MRQEVNITQEESSNIQNLYETYMSYIAILQFFMNQDNINKTTFDDKWNEAVDLNKKLDHAKHKIEKKYKPAGEWDRFEFDFDNHQVVFIKNGT